MSRPTGRVLTLLELLQSGGVRTVAELADRLGVDGRTVRRYVDHLIDLDVPVEAVRGRYGGYRLGAGYRLPPLMLGDDEALAVLLGLVAGRRAGLMTAADTAGETAAAKIRRVLPERVARRLDALLESLAFTDAPGAFATPDVEVLLTLADAVRHRRPVALTYTDRDGRRGARTLHPYGIVAHAGRWYVPGTDPGIGADRTFRLDRIEGARTLPGSFEVPAGPDPAERVLSGFATAAYRHQVTLRIHGTVAQIRARLPAGVASVDGVDSMDSMDGMDGMDGAAPSAAADPAAQRWRRVELRAEHLDWLPPVLASLDRPFVVERPAELRDLVRAFADRLASCAAPPDSGEPPPDPA
ncbi:transcriptional regulator [Actinacidiphila yanglinensis]|uniref:Transcriptional regulator n=1 Tax=Actinacidiphila yanglinensis TaxID=310779 RepID=A0A1H6D4N8_9ACTN|nr:YafY family protein [Actinacidiphila yanglinensis]SEG80302.1 transcriptional regulator [Actinacidiphila yanglinensis]